MKKRGYIGRLAALALVLCMVTMSLTAGTLAKYAGKASGNATATVAKWAIKFTDGGSTEYNDSNTITLNLKDTVQEGKNLVAADKIAPGTSGSFNLAVDGTGTEVAFKYTISLDLAGITNDGTTTGTCPLKFYKTKTGNTYSDELTTGAAEISGNVLLNGGTQPDAQTIYWVWNTTTDEDDTTLGTDSAKITEGLVYKIPVTVKAEQLLTTT